MKKTFLLLIIFIVISSVSFAHSGRTDSSGGHYDRSTGEYHYHNGSNSVFKDNDDDLIAELQQKNSNLEDEIYNLKEKISEYENDLEEVGFESIQDLNQELVKKENEISNLWVIFIFLIIIIASISYNMGLSKNTNKK